MFMNSKRLGSNYCFAWGEQFAAGKPLASLELFVTGDETGFYDSVSVSGKSNGTKVTLGGTEPLGSTTSPLSVTPAPMSLTSI